MTDTEVDIGDFPLPATMRAGWKPEEIVYARYTFDPVDPKGTLKGDPTGYVICGMDVETFVRARLAGGPLPNSAITLPQTPPTDTTVRAIDIYIRKPCHVVIELDPKLDWQFKIGQPGLTAEDDNHDDNGDVRHVMSDGRILKSAGPDSDGCRIIYFGVNRRCTSEHQKFFCHIDFGSRFALLPDPFPLVDPDIPNDGGKFPFARNRLHARNSPGAAGS